MSSPPDTDGFRAVCDDCPGWPFEWRAALDAAATDWRRHRHDRHFSVRADAEPQTVPWPAPPAHDPDAVLRTIGAALSQLTTPGALDLAKALLDARRAQLTPVFAAHTRVRLAGGKPQRHGAVVSQSGTQVLVAWDAGFSSRVSAALLHPVEASS